MDKVWDLCRFDTRTAATDDSGRSITYRQLNDEAQALSETIGKRCLVFSLCRNEIGSLLGYVAFLNNKIVTAQFSSNLDRTLLNDLMDIYKPSYLWAPVDVKDKSDMVSVYDSHEYCLLSTGYATGYELYDELALLITTSGSTGSPKLVRQSYVNIKSNMVSIAEYLGIDENERPITTLPMNYVYGLSIINSHLLKGATLLLTDKGIMQKEFWSFFTEAKATSFGGVPYTYEMLDKLRFYRMSLPDLKTMTQAGGKITPELQEKFARYAEETGKNFVVMYGASEATSRMGYLPPEKALEKKGSMGIPIPGGKFTIIDDSGAEIKEAFTTGELVYEGDNVTLGYAECGDDLSRGDERNGRLETGDMAQYDEDGYYYIVGRKKRFLKVFGNRVNLDELDRMIKGSFSIEVASSGIDDHIFIFVTEEAIVDELKRFVAEKTKINPSAFKVIVIEEIPKNDSGKVLYKELAKFYE